MNRKIGLGLAVLALICLSLCIVDAAIDAILYGGKVHITELAGQIEYMTSPFVDWVTTLNTQAGSEWRGRVRNIQMDYAGEINITWSLWDCGPDDTIGTMDDTAIPGATFRQTIVVSPQIPQNVTASSDGFNPYNWGQWTGGEMTVYIQAHISEA